RIEATRTGPPGAEGAGAGVGGAIETWMSHTGPRTASARPTQKARNPGPGPYCPSSRRRTPATARKIPVAATIRAAAWRLRFNESRRAGARGSRGQLHPGVAVDDLRAVLVLAP